MSPVCAFKPTRIKSLPITHLLNISYTPILSMYHLSHYPICVSKPFFIRKSLSAKKRKATTNSQEELCMHELHPV